ncbi:RNA polymerase sigma-70 factor (ECF subfamily) [Kineothrix alysoides]|uniref:RNA polymerase sigma-70 factor (ECF subfamily) n=1 Tax=Kineothrix alysoides TaxID=1469948 RepID=A0A4R1R4I0_9FIRM|nr:sigma-70 family RNA polymerase sigma factor [Kineothrix alysoides]TCL60328.1 RNA polymerase sigma-70 factor (ECF subfamily) [Kineothrix alysoides]
MEQHESEIVERVKRKEPGAFDCLYERYKDQAYRMAVFITGNTADAQDVVQDTFVTVCLEIGQLRETAAFPAWFYRILTRNAIQLSKRKKREFPREELWEDSIDCGDGGIMDPSKVLLEKEENRIIRASISQLEEKYRTVLVLYYFNEFSVKQIAGIVGCTEGTIKSRLHKARKLLERKIRIKELK